MLPLILTVLNWDNSTPPPPLFSCLPTLFRTVRIRGNIPIQDGLGMLRALFIEV